MPSISSSCILDNLEIQLCVLILQFYFSVDSKFYDVKTICDSEMILGTDYEWEKLSRTTFAVDFDKICQKSQISLLNSLYFVGGTIGLLFGEILFFVKQVFPIKIPGY